MVLGRLGEPVGLSPCEYFWPLRLVNCTSVADGNLAAFDTELNGSPQVIFRIDNLRFDTGFCIDGEVISFRELPEQHHKKS